MIGLDVKALMLIVGTALLSGFGDSQGFVHSSSMWQSGRFVARECVKSAAGFAVGIGSYWFCVRYLKQCGVLAPETQTLIWFAVTMLGIALASGEWLRWHRADQAVALVVVLGLGWLMFRHR
jgi:hypothetical protein